MKGKPSLDLERVAASIRKEELKRISSVRALTLESLVASLTVLLAPQGLAQPSGPCSALLFDGTSGSYVSIATTGSLTGTFTVEMWANPNDPTGNNVTVSSRFSPQGEYSFDFGLRNADEIHGDIGTGSSWITINADAYFPYATGVWHHLAYVVTPGGYSIYGDGVLVGFGGVGESGAVLCDSAHGLALGGNTTCCGIWNGQIDEVRIWSTARSAEDIQANMYHTLTGTEAGLMGYWRFDEGSGTTTADASGHGFTGTLISGVSWVASTAPISNAPVARIVLQPRNHPGLERLSCASNCLSRPERRGGQRRDWLEVLSIAQTMTAPRLQLQTAERRAPQVDRVAGVVVARVVGLGWTSTLLQPVLAKNL